MNFLRKNIIRTLQSIQLNMLKILIILILITEIQLSISHLLQLFIKFLKMVIENYFTNDNR